MSKAVLIVEPNDARRVAIRQSLAARGLQTLEVGEAFSGLAALGRADFGAIIVAEGKRHLSLKGLIQLARKRHEEIRIFVILSAVANADHVSRVLGTDVTMVPPEWGVEQLGNAVNDAIEAQGGPAPNPWQGESVPPDRPGGGANQSEPPVPVAGPRAVPAAIALGDDGFDDLPEIDADVSLEGTLEDGSGAGLLMGLFAQELTGRLDVRGAEGAASGTLYFYRGEPVWADDAGGDVDLFARIVAEGMLPADTVVEPLPQGALLPHLVETGRLSAERAHELMQKTVREHVLDLANSHLGAYEFNEDRTFLEHAPLLKLNPFGLIFESRRRAYTPDKLLAIGSELGGRYLHPGPGLGVAAEKLRPFMRNVDVSELIDGHGTVESFARDSGLDLLMGTLMVLTLIDARLVSLAEHEMITDDSVVNVTRDSVLRSEWDDRSLPEAAQLGGSVSLVDGSDGSAAGGEGQAGGVASVASREEILQIYVRMKPLTAPAQVLGVPLEAKERELDEAYRARMSELHDDRIPDCEDAALLRSHFEELRRKVQSAYETLRLEAPAGGGPTVDSNPF